MGQSNDRVSDTDYRKIADFLYDEAELLAERRYQEWGTLLAEDIHYLVLQPEFFEDGSARSVGIGNPYFDDDYKSLGVRIKLLGNPRTTTAENPPSQMSFFVSNIRPRHRGNDEYEVTSRLLIYRVRASEPAPFILAGKRQDVLRVDGDGFKIARREVRLHQASIQSPNMSFLL